MSNQVYSNNNDPYWLSARGLDKISFNKLTDPPIGYLNKGIIYELTDGKLYFNGSELVTGASSIVAQSLATTTDPVDVASSPAPIAGMVLTTTSETTAVWGSSPPAPSLMTTSNPVDIYTSPSPTVGQVLTATSNTSAEWKNTTAGISPPTGTVGVDEIGVFANSGGTKLNSSYLQLKSYSPNGIVLSNALHTGTYTSSTMFGGNIGCAGANLNGVIVGQSSATGCPNLDKVIIVGNNNLLAGAGYMATGTIIIGNNCINNGSFAGGTYNTAVGNYNLNFLSTGFQNTTIGHLAGYTITTGNRNVMLGQGTGNGLNTGSDNIHVGCTDPISSSESGAIRIGSASQTSAYLAGVYNNTVNNGLSQTVCVDSNNKVYALPIGSATPIGEVYFDNFATPYTIPLTINVPVVLAPVTTLVSSANFTSPAAGQLKYTGSLTSYAQVSVSMSEVLFAGVNSIIEFYILKNALVVPGSHFRKQMPNATDFVSVSFNKVMQFIVNDIITVGCVNLSDGNDLTIGNLNISAIVGR